MDGFFEEYATYYKYNYDNIMYLYNNLLKDGRYILGSIIDTKIKMGRDLYKQDMYILANTLAHKFDVNINFANYDEFILCANKILEKNNILNISLKIIDSLYDHDYCMLMAYYIGTFLEDEPFDIKIALKD